MQLSVAWTFPCVTALSLCITQAFALDDTPDILLEDDPLAYEFVQPIEQKLLLIEQSNSALDTGYLALMPMDIQLPDPVVIAPGKPESDEMVIVAAAPPEKIFATPPEWVLYQGNRLSQAPEERVFVRINTEYAYGEASCVPGFDCPTVAMELPPWPDDAPVQGTPFEIFDTDLISPFAPIPELDLLPFPDA